jgi:hypothetical protein
VTEAIVADVTAWQESPLPAALSGRLFDALRVKIRDEIPNGARPVQLALAVLPDGGRDILGIWIKQRESAEVLDEGLHGASPTSLSMKKNLLDLPDLAASEEEPPGSPRPPCE